MANQIILKRSATPAKVPTTGQLALGEIAINTYDGLLYIKKDNGTASVVQIGGVTSVNGETGAVTIDTGDVAENGNLYFTNARARSALSAGSGISYNSSTGAISTTQNLTTAGSPTFAGLTLTGNMGITGNIIPSASNVYSLGSAEMPFKDVFVGPGSLYVNGVEVIHSMDETMNFTADIDQNMRLTTTGTGVLQLGSNTTVVQMAGTLQITSGKNITDSAGTSVGFGNAINMNTNRIVSLGAPSSSTDAATKGYVDTSVAAISTSTISQGNSSVAVVDAGTGTVTVTVDGSTALTVNSSGVVVAGNFTVSGTTTTVNSNTVSVADNILTLNSDTTGSPSQNAGIEIERGDEANTQVRWNEGSDKWTFTNDGAVYYPMATSTTDLVEGTSLYFTDARARGAVSASSATGVSYNSSTGLISLGSIPNSALSNNAITINGVSTALGGTRTLDSDSISEGVTNLYHTTARARSALSAGTGISYNSTTGAISTSAIPNASLANSAVTVGSTAISLGASSTTLAGLTSVTSTSFTGALTGNADTATSAGKWTTARTITLAGDLTGSVSIDGSANATLTATVAANSVALGTDTTGNYMVDLTAGTGITVTHTAGEGSTATVAVDTSTIATKAYVDSSVQAKDNTDELTEGTTNLFFTNARARSAVSAGTGISYNSTTGVITNTITQYTDALARGAISVTDAGGDGSLSYNSTTGVITYTGPSASEVRAHFSAGTGITVSSGVIATTITQYTDALARGAVSAGTGISYNSTTGVITNTITQYTDALARGAVSAGTGISYNSSTGVITNSDLGSSQNIFKNFTDGTTTAAADSNTDTFKFRGSNGVTVAVASDDATHGDSLLISLSSVPNASLANSSITVAGTSVSLGGSVSISTSNVSEGSNLYYTDARARAAITAGTGITVTSGVVATTITQYTDALARASNSAGTGISYNSTTGVITNTITQYTDALAVSANTSAIATAKSEAISAAASDATTKANAAQAAAIAAVTNGAGAAFDTLVEIQNAMATDAELSAAIAALTIGNGTQTVTAGSYLTGGGSFTANQTGASSVTLNVDATSANTASKVVARDASGNFSAGTITAALSGNATTASTVASISGNTVSSSQITTGLGFTPYNATNPSGYTTNTGTVTSVGGTGTVSGLTLSGSVTTSGNLTLGGTLSVANSSTTATNLNTASAIVARDASGNFSAGTITATLTGQASTVASISGNTVSSSQITTGLGYTPYNATNPSGFTTNLGTVTSVTGTGPVVSSGGTTPAISMAAATSTVNGYMTSTYAAKLDGIASGATNVTNTNQLTNGAGFITGYTETDTLSSVTGRGASTGTAITISNSTASSSKTTGALIVTGGVGISGALFVGGEVTAYASDAALKTNVVAIDGALSKVEAIRGVSYDWNEAGVALGLGTDKQIGVIAQEVEAVLPELVVDSAHEGYKTVKYDKLTALLIEAVKELSAEVKTLKAQLGNK